MRHAELLSGRDPRAFWGDFSVSMLVLVPTRSNLANLEWEDSQSELHEKVDEAKLVVINGAGHNIDVDWPEDCQRVFPEFFEALGKKNY